MQEVLQAVLQRKGPDASFELAVSHLLALRIQSNVDALTMAEASPQQSQRKKGVLFEDVNIIYVMDNRRIRRPAVRNAEPHTILA
ncbi:hypothetical protein, partial [Bradyrhizobium sp.]|uniref:hypothetical protein n=1 Tax=Bradyrhizobium sp. TaxID=376 RepID=UPI0025BA820C